MNQGQERFFGFILERVQDGQREQAEALLRNSFAQQAAGTFDMNKLNDFHQRLTAMLKPEHVSEVVAILSQFGSQHVNK